MSLRHRLSIAWVLLALSGSSAAGQITITGSAPWIDPTSPGWGAKCDGFTDDDTLALQTSLNAVLSTGSAWFVPASSSGCYVKGYSTVISAASGGSCGSPAGFCTITITLTSGTGFTAGGLVNIHNVGPGTMHSTIFNGTYSIVTAGTLSGGACVVGGGGSPCLTYYVPQAFYAGSDPATLYGSNSVAEIGLYFAGNNLKVIGAAASQYHAGGSMLLTDQAITILTTMSSTAPPNSGPDIQNLTFRDSAGIAFAGLNIGNTNSFNVSNDGFTGFFASSAGAAAVDPQGGAGIVTFGGPATPTNATPWVQFGKVENNHIEAKFGFTSKYKISSVTFDSNTVQCHNVTTSPGLGSVGLDIGGLWFLNNYDPMNDTGDENRVINQQNQSCLVGTMLGQQNNDRVETKLENNAAACNVSGLQTGQVSLTGTTTVNWVAGSSDFATDGSWLNATITIGGSPFTIMGLTGGAHGSLVLNASPGASGNAAYVIQLCTVGLALLKTTDSIIFNQSKKVVTGLYIDPSSTNNTIYENGTGGALSTGNSGTAFSNFCLNPTSPFNPTCASGILPGGVTGYGFTSASLVVDPAVPSIAAGTTVVGTPSGGGFAPTPNSTFTSDYDPLLNAGITSPTSNYTAALIDSYILCSASGMTITLPTSASAGQLTGKAYRIKNIAGGTCTVNVAGVGGLIDNLSSFPLPQWQAVDVVYNGGTQYYTF